MTGITKETFQSADNKTQLAILFDYHKGTHEKTEIILALMREHPIGCTERFKSLEKKRFYNTALSACLGFIGGFAAVIAKLNFWGK